MTTSAETECKQIVFLDRNRYRIFRSPIEKSEAMQRPRRGHEMTHPTWDGEIWCVGLRPHIIPPQIATSVWQRDGVIMYAVAGQPSPGPIYFFSYRKPSAMGLNSSNYL